VLALSFVAPLRDAPLRGALLAARVFAGGDTQRNARVDALIASKQGQKYVLGARTMKEWVAFSDGTAASWRALAREARKFVGG
jgi:hypothetical protein